MAFIKLFSDNYNGEIVTKERYEEIRLEMSSGDFGTHYTKELTDVESGEKCESCNDVGYLEVTTEEGEENQWCQECVIIEPDYDPPAIKE